MSVTCARGQPHGSTGRVFTPRPATPSGSAGWAWTLPGRSSGTPGPEAERIRRKPVLGGLINEYTHAA